MKIANGTEFSHYRILQPLGKGGMGSVYLALDLELDRKVAIKFLTPAHESKDAPPGGRAEARMAALQDHPSAVKVHETGRFRGVDFLVMEYIEGTSLADLLQAESRLPPERAIAITRELCAGIAALHAQGVRHGDVKPANVMLDRHGRVRILDFGVASQIDTEDQVADEALAGTVRYMAPELHHGGQAGAAADLFAVGVLLYRMVAGRLPFDGAYDAEAVYAITNKPPEPLGEIGVRLPRDLVALIDRLLDKDASRRPSAADTVTALEALGGGGGAAASPRHGLGPRRIWTVAGLAGAAILLAWLTWSGPRDARRHAGATPTVAVLPFENLGAPAEASFADVVTDAVTIALAQVGACRVISRHSTTLYKSTTKTPQLIAEELGADFLVTGSIRWARDQNDKVEISVAVVDPQSAEYIWTHNYSGQRAGILRLQTGIAGDIAKTVAAGGRREPPARASTQPTSNLAAYDLYLRGNEYFNRSWERADIEAAAQLFRRAIATDSGFALAYAMLARCEASMYWERYDRGDSARIRAFAAARTALALAPDLPEAHLAMGYCYYHCERDFARALEQFEAGLNEDPDHPELLNAVAAVHRRQGNLPLALSEFETALELDPRSHLKAFDVGLTLGMLRRYREAETYLERTTLLAPDYALAWIYRIWLPILDQGDTASARAILESALATTDLSHSKYYWVLCRILPPTQAQLDRGCAFGCDRVSYYLYRARLARARSDAARERTYSDSARVLLKAVVLADPDNAYAHSDLGLALAGVGDHAGARAEGQEAVRLLPGSREAFDAPFLILNLAEIMVVTGSPDLAIDQLALLLQIPGFASGAYLGLDFVFRPLSDRPRFKALVESTANPS